MGLDEHELVGEQDTLARHIKLAEVFKGERSLEWSDVEIFIYDSHCLTSRGKHVAEWSIVILQAFLKDTFLVKARHTPEILTIHPFFELNFFPGANDVPRVYADVFRFALQLYLLQSLERFRGMLKDTTNNLEAVRWYHTLLELEVASLGQKEGWQVQFELPYTNGSNNKSDVVLSREGIRLEVDAVSVRISERGRKKQRYDNWLVEMSIQYGVRIAGRIGEPWGGTKVEEVQWIQKVYRTLFFVSTSGLSAIVHGPGGGNLVFERAAYGKTGMATIHDADIHENIWDRIRVTLDKKNTQASGNAVWLCMGEYAGLWHWTEYSKMTLEEKLYNLSLLIQPALESFPHIEGVLLSPGILPVYHSEVQIPGKFSSDNGSIALRCSLPGYCMRETIIIPRRGRDVDARALAVLYEYEDTWLDWALQQAGHPPFHLLMREQ